MIKKREKRHVNRILKIDRNILFMIGVFTLGLAIRFLGFSFVSGDMRAYLIPWYKEISHMSLGQILSTQVGDYGTLYQFLIFIMTRIDGKPIVMYKLLSIIGDISLACGAYCLAVEWKDHRFAIPIMTAVFLWPSVILNSAFWGQCDAIYCSCIIWALYFLYKNKSCKGFLFLGLAFAFKLQTVFIFPFVGFWVLKKVQKKELRILAATGYLLMIPGVGLALAIPNMLAGRSIGELAGIYFHQTVQYPFMVQNTLSVWALFDLEYNTWHIVAIILTFTLLFILLMWLLAQGDKVDYSGRHFIWCAFLFTFMAVLFLPAMHERYNFLYDILAIILVVCVRRGYVQLFLMQVLTMRTYMFFLFGVLYNAPLCAALNLLIFISFMVGFVLEIKGGYQPLALFARVQVPGENFGTAEKAGGEEIGTAEKLPGDIERKEKLELQEKKTKWTDDRTGSGRVFMCGEVPRMGRTTVRGVILITVVFLALGLFHLGSMDAPQHGMEFENEEIYLEFDETENIDKAFFFVGETHEGNVHMFVPNQNKWASVGENRNLGSVFTWNEVAISRSTWEVAMVFDHAIIREIVLIDDNGEQLLPNNADAYPALFDEQSTFVNPPTYENGTMFDEVYHGRTAYEILHGLGIYENTHPPLGKILISAGIAAFGMTPFGWRIMSVLFGALMIPLIALFAWRLTQKHSLTMLAAILLATEFMHFTLSRIATIDIIVAFFVWGMFYGMLAFVQEEKKRYLLVAGIFSGLAIATKWTGVYAMMGIAILWFVWFVKKIWQKWNWKEAAVIISVCVGCFIMIPTFCYVMSYIPFVKVYPDQGLIEHAISNGKSMLAYHSSVFAEHAYASKWYTWLINWRPVLDAFTGLGKPENSIMASLFGQRISTVATFVNPLTSIVGLLCVPYLIVRAVRKKDEKAGTLALLYLVMLAPWMFITRTVFIYQYFICTQVLILMICYTIQTLHFVYERRVIILTAGISTLLFVMFFPVISGIPVAYSYVYGVLQFLPSWVL